ncbi:hypothetical protein DSECCO2_546150 [anaerobic digester metagenome]
MLCSEVEVVHTVSGRDMYTACIFHGYEVCKVNTVLYLVLDRHEVPDRAFVFELC